MSDKPLGAGWQEMGEEMLAGVVEWRLQHPKATFREIEQAIDQRLNRLRSKMLEDTARVSAASQWQAADAAAPLCPACGVALVARGKQARHLQTQGGQEVTLERSYGVCPACGAGLFPPG